MDSVDALLVETRLSPEDDTCRLVLADWLDENGDDAGRGLAEFVRIQCQLARLPRNAPARSDLEWRQRSLWWQHVERWLGLLYEASVNFEFRRGLAKVEMHGDRLAGYDLERVLSDPAWRWVDELILVQPRSEQFATLLDAPAVGWLGRLEVRDGRDLLRDRFTLQGAEGPLLLRELNLSACRLDDRVLGLLAEAPGLAGLEVLELYNNEIGGLGLEALMDSPLASLRELNLRGNRLGSHWPAGLTGFFRGPMAARLTRLGLGFNQLNLEHIAALSRSPCLGRLVELDLAGNSLNDIAVETLAGSPSLPALLRLDLSDNPIGPAGVRALTTTPHLDGLEELDLVSRGLDGEALQALINAPGWHGLRRLRLSRNIGDWYSLVSRLRWRFGYALELA